MKSQQFQQLGLYTMHLFRSITLMGLLIAGGCAQAGSEETTTVVVSSAGECNTTALKGRRSFDVGPEHKFKELTQVPWLALRAGDVVNIHYRPEPYRTKIAIRAQGTAKAPVVINGVTDAQCNRPVITGENAVTATDLARAEYFNEYTEQLAAILIYKAPFDPWGFKPRFIEIRNLVITGARPSSRFTQQDGRPAHFQSGSAGLYAVTVDDLLVENCEITGNGNGIFVNTKNDSEAETSYRITIRNNQIHQNGIVGSYYEHNLYIQAVRALYEGNYIGQLVRGAEGSSLKDRSSGTVIRFNHIVAAARAIDLVETEGGTPTVFKDPQYNDAWVYGNLIISDHTNPGYSSTNLIHWGGDGNPPLYKTGTLYFYNNTVFTRSDLTSNWRLSVFDLPSGDQKVELRSNVFVHQGSTNFYLATRAGQITFAGTNWISKGWQPRAYEEGVFAIKKEGTLIEGTDAGLQPDFTLRDGSPAIDKAPAAPAHLAERWIDREYAPVGHSVPRATVGAADDLGAFERGLHTQ